MLESARLTASVATANPRRSRAFYENTLGLRLVEDDQFALLFESNGTPLRIQKVEKVEPPPFTVLGCHVPNIREVVAGLSKRGVACERFSFLPQDDVGVWVAPSGTRVAWFKDPDRNLLSRAES